MSEKSILAGVFRMGDQAKRNIKDFVRNPRDSIDNIVHQNNIEWKKDPIERSLGFFNPVPLGTIGNFALRKEMEEAVTNLSRRDFMKKSAGMAAQGAVGGTAGAKLLQKFAPEERAIAKEAVAEAAPKHRYNSLKEYLDDVQAGVKLKAEDAFPHTGKDAWTPREYEEYINRDFRNRLLEDEDIYRAVKGGGSRTTTNGKIISIDDYLKPPEYHTIYPNDPSKNIKWKDAFSPQAKQEMAAYKGYINNVNNAAKHEYAHPGYNENALEWSNPDVIKMYLDESVPF